MLNYSYCHCGVIRSEPQQWWVGTGEHDGSSHSDLTGTISYEIHKRSHGWGWAYSQPETSLPRVIRISWMGFSLPAWVQTCPSLGPWLRWAERAWYLSKGNVDETSGRLYHLQHLQVLCRVRAAFYAVVWWKSRYWKHTRPWQNMCASGRYPTSFDAPAEIALVD